MGPGRKRDEGVIKCLSAISDKIEISDKAEKKLFWIDICNPRDSKLISLGKRLIPVT